MRLRSIEIAFAIGATSTLVATPAAAQPRSEQGVVEGEDLFAYSLHVETIGRLFRRAGYDARGSLVEGGIALPLYNFARLRIDDLDTPWGDDSVDVELGAWGNLNLAEAGPLQRLDGDVQVARIRQRFDHGYVTLGRQVRGGGAARFVRFDGAQAAVHAPFGLGLETYGGFTVLPRWNQQPGYHLLGSAAEELVRDPAVLQAPAREQHWLVGGRVYYTDDDVIDAGLSFHEQRADGGLARRTAGLDASYTPLDLFALTGRVLLDVDATEVPDLRAVLDLYPFDSVVLSASYQHLIPALMLSRQSVLSVFSTSAFDEWGIDGQWRATSWLRVGGDAYLDRFEGGAFGHRAGGHLRVSNNGAIHTVARIGYRRVQEAINGYHQLRASASLRPWPRAHLTADGFLYLYDEPISGVSSSVVGVISGGYEVARYLELLIATSLARSPYALTDVQSTLRVEVDWEGEVR